MPLPRKIEEQVYLLVSLKMKRDQSNSSITLSYPQADKNNLLAEILGKLRTSYNIQNDIVQDHVNSGCCQLDVYLSIVIDILQSVGVIENIKKDIKKIDGRFDDELLKKYQECLEEMLDSMEVDKNRYLESEFFDVTITTRLIREIGSSFHKANDTINLSFNIPLN